MSWFCVLQPCWTLLVLNEFLLVDSLSFSLYKILSFENRDNFTTFFPVCMLFPFSCLIALARTPSTMLRSGESWHLWFFVDLRGKVSLVWYWLWTFHRCPWLSWGKFLFLPSWWNVFIMKGCWSFSNAFFFCNNWDDHVVSSFIALIWYIWLIFVY